MTTKDLLAAKGEELSLMLGEILQPEHYWAVVLPHHGIDYTFCRNCSCKKSDASDFCDKAVNLDDWNAAMKWRDWAVEEYGYVKLYNAMREVYRHHSTHEFSSWYDFLLRAKPKHYLKAAAICVLNTKPVQCLTNQK